MATSLHTRVSADALFIGNGLGLYPNNPPDHGMATLPYLDGVVWEHFLGFEMLDDSNGSLVPALYQQAVDLITQVSVASNKTVLVKAWPGYVIYVCFHGCIHVCVYVWMYVFRCACVHACMDACTVLPLRDCSGLRICFFLFQACDNTHRPSWPQLEPGCGRCCAVYLRRSRFCCE
jgi:hypothetical protein